MESIFDLPTHVFLVHVPVVLVPLVCVAAIAVAVRPDWRRRYGTLLVVLALAALVSVLLTVNSGQAFDNAIDFGEDIEKHKDLAETTRLLVIGLFLVTLALVLVGRRHDATDADAGGSSGQAMLGLAGVTVVLAVLSTVWIVRTGHEGASVAWEGWFPVEEADSAAAATTTSTTTSTPPTSTSGTTASSTSTIPTTSVVPAAIDGAAVYAANCARCHGDTAEGGRGPSLIANELSAAEIQAQIRVGGGGMLSFQDRLTDPEIAAVVEFVEAL